MFMYYLSVSAIFVSGYRCYDNPTVDCIPWLVSTISLNPNPLHRDETPAVFALIKIGEPAIGPVVGLMLSDDGMARLRAEGVLQSITAKQFGYSGREGWPSKAHRARWMKYWADHGDLGFKDPPEKRRAGVKKWKEMIENERKRK
jgi:hypothetical protein